LPEEAATGDMADIDLHNNDRDGLRNIFSRALIGEVLTRLAERLRLRTSSES